MIEENNGGIIAAEEERKIEKLKVDSIIENMSDPEKEAASQGRQQIEAEGVDAYVNRLTTSRAEFLAEVKGEKK